MSNIRRSSIQEFIEKAKKVHDNKYNYGKFIYVNNATKGIIICPIHGEFLQSPNSHLSIHGCSKCGFLLTTNARKLTTEEFIRLAIATHGYKFDYSRVVYINMYTKVIIICPIHGEFKQEPDSHLRGRGCNKCWIDRLKNIRTKITEDYIKEVQKIYDNKYDLSKIIYTHSRDKIIIGCYIHGDFEQRADLFLLGHGCQECSNVTRGNKLSIIHCSNKEEFIKKAIATHGNKFGYSKVIYINSWTKVIIICPKHGEFFQTPNSHLQGAGCPTCRSSKGELAIRSLLQKHSIEFIQEYRLPNQPCRFEYDFYLPKFNILIEFHGIQHFQINEYFGGEEAFQKTKLYDKLKIELAKLANIKFIEFNYLQLKQLSKEQFEEMVIKRINKFK